ncbi:hypothetical protein [Streptomyces sp. KY70]|uniref:hypothetical protein n=1 Tax=Streptomyces sp. KY70 TaxID=2772432 RepID=UPI001AFC7D7F|nr:protein of unknown function [Streptomyces sp. KY70]
MSPPGLYRRAVGDLDMIRSRDPSVHSRTEALLHPAVPAVWGHRVAHRLHRRGCAAPRGSSPSPRGWRRAGSRSTPAPGSAAASSSTTAREW